MKEQSTPTVTKTDGSKYTVKPKPRVKMSNAAVAKALLMFS